jgi:hypothetical protein
VIGQFGGKEFKISSEGKDPAGRVDDWFDRITNQMVLPVLEPTGHLCAVVFDNLLKYSLSLMINLNTRTCVNKEINLAPIANKLSILASTTRALYESSFFFRERFSFMGTYLFFLESSSGCHRRSHYYTTTSADNLVTDRECTSAAHWHTGLEFPLHFFLPSQLIFLGAQQMASPMQMAQNPMVTVAPPPMPLMASPPYAFHFDYSIATSHRS